MPKPLSPRPCFPFLRGTIGLPRNCPPSSPSFLPIRLPSGRTFLSPRAEVLPIISRSIDLKRSPLFIEERPPRIGTRLPFFVIHLRFAMIKESCPRRPWYSSLCVSHQ